MKFSIQTKILKDMLTTLSRIVVKDVSSSSLGSVCVKVSSGAVTFKTQSIDFSVIYTISIGDSVDGVVYIPVQVFDGVVSSLIDSMTTIELQGKKLIIQTSTTTSEIYIKEEEDSITVTKPDKKPFFTLEREVLVRGFKSVQHAAAESVIKPEIASVYLYTKNDSVYFVSTDAFRLSEIRFLLEKKQDDDVSILIPIKSVGKILRVLESIADVTVDLCVSENNLYFSTETVFIKTNSVKGVFPDYKGIIPKSFDVDITLRRDDVLVFLKQARFFSDNLNKFSFSVQDSTHVTLEFSNETVGSTKNTIPAVVKGDVSDLPSFNYRFVHDSLSIISDERVIFSLLNNPTKPLMIRGVDNSALTTIISPLLEK